MHPSIIKMQPFVLDFQSDIASTIQGVCGDSVDVIVHLAALSSPFFCENHPREAWIVNVPIGLLTLKAPVIYMSTDQVYEGTKQCYSEDDDATLPVNLYGRTKLAFERVLTRGSIQHASSPILNNEELGNSTIPEFLSSSRLSSIASHPSSVILRSSLILGKPTPFANGCKKGSFPSFLQFVESRLKSSTPTDYFTNEYRSVVHVRDVLRAILHFTQQALISGNGSCSAVRTFNLGGSERVNRYDLANQVASQLKLDGSCVKGVERPKDEGGVPSPPDISMNVDKLTKELGMDKLDGLEEIIKAVFVDSLGDVQYNA
jgi:dTDP-4-dehydrorhamnose reductase